MDEFGTIFLVCFSISLSEAELNEQFYGGRAIRVQFVQGVHVSKAILLYYFVLSLVAIVRGIISLMRFASYFSCLRFGGYGVI